jgi:hypothetical protein
MHEKKTELYINIDRGEERISLGEYYVPDSDLQIGDVLFCAPKKWKSRLIQLSTAGAYTHCGIYLGNSQVADSTIYRGVSISALSAFETKYQYVMVTRCPGISSDPNDSLERKRDISIRIASLKNYIEIHVAKRVCYNLFGAVLVPFREWLFIKQFSWEHSTRLEHLFSLIIPKRIYRDSMFCSEFVVRCFMNCGYIPSDEYSHVFSPTALATDGIFDRVGYRSSDSPYRA